MKISGLFTMAFIALGSTTLSASANAEQASTQLDSETIRVVNFKGKPPHKRTYISRTESPERYQHYAMMLNSKNQEVLTAERRGAPGKSLPGNFHAINKLSDEVAEFARFEEVSDHSNGAQRSWRGAPGKHRRIK